MSDLLTFEGLSKAWFGVPAVSDLDYALRENSLLGVIGQNGAGKSTLMNMIGGIVQPSGGRMLWRGAPYAPQSAADASKVGIAFIHQELNLFTNLSVAENLYVDGFPRKFGIIDWAAINERTRSILQRLSLDDVEPSVKVGQLSPGERQLVEIARALHNEAQLIIFDEPTTSLTHRETERLFETIATLREEGRTIVYISHILGDVQSISDGIAVLRDGRLVDHGAAADFPVSRMIKSMIGRDLGGLFPPRSNQPDSDLILSARSIGQPGVLEKASIDVRKGEVLGLFGLMGAGRSELARVLFGLDPHATGDILLNGQPLTGGPRNRIAAGMAFVTENRREEGLMLDASIADNLALVSIDRFGRKPFALVDMEALSTRTEAMKAELSIKAGNIARQAAKTLSGGNQQKVVIGKWQMQSPKLFILDEPTRGVDVGAKYEIYTLVDRIAADGGGVLMISSELDELLGMADRIVVMNRGEVIGSVDRADFDREKLLAMAFREVTA
ncbi:sugar ABC transporter ATP-binding protein [Bauldia litoralis]|uniref:Monosaccharide ABC transporter ATP-binding protein, CUT2 family (TC 3.A.1.2.-) n=1 Tax=Bauldia litoralis TaxID=665467 RepID=A0A1G6CWQ6_9HYPH|nr:sugar ABC transporter ATP-binding protein [Bauldia litoralis]SDB37324.1 monosaccharide ABC transporter ATP-binding protein, CUT2 family (TC 3.A.1.2.-) [Bauldia litoralis]